MDVSRAHAAAAARLLQWRTTFPRSGDVPIIAHHRPQHPSCQVHSHDFIEIVLVAGGSGVQQTPAGDLALSRGDVIILRPGGWHGYVDCEGLEIYNVVFGSGLLQRELSWALEDPALSFLLVSGPLAADARGVLHLHLNETCTRVCQGHVDELCEACLRDESLAASGALLARRLGLLLVVLGDVLDGAGIRSGAVLRPGGLHPAVARGMRLLESDLARNWVLAELCVAVGLERSYLIRQFRQGTGLPPMSYLARRRAERAASLLVHTRESIAAIARQVGWPEPVHFARRFRHAFGMTASDYRRRFAAAAAPGDGGR